MNCKGIAIASVNEILKRPIPQGLKQLDAGRAAHPGTDLGINGPPRKGRSRPCSVDSLASLLDAR